MFWLYMASNKLFLSNIIIQRICSEERITRSCSLWRKVFHQRFFSKRLTSDTQKSRHTEKLLSTLEEFDHKIIIKIIRWHFTRNSVFGLLLHCTISKIFFLISQVAIYSTAKMKSYFPTFNWQKSCI